MPARLARLTLPVLTLVGLTACAAGPEDADADLARQLHGTWSLDAVNGQPLPVADLTGRSLVEACLRFTRAPRGLLDSWFWDAVSQTPAIVGDAFAYGVEDGVVLVTYLGPGVRLADTAWVTGTGAGRVLTLTRDFEWTPRARYEFHWRAEGVTLQDCRLPVASLAR